MKSAIGILSLIITLSIIPFAFADIPFDQVAQQEIKIYVGNGADARVVHDIRDFNGTAKVEFIDGHSNLNVPCLLSCPYELDNAEQNFEASKYMVLSQYPAFHTDLTIEYDLENVLKLKDGLWKWNFSDDSNPGFYFDDEIDMVFINSTPIDISQAPGIKCRGSGGDICEMTLEFFHKDKTLSSSFIEPYILIQTDGKISNFKIENHIYPNTIKFDVKKQGQYVLIDIPTNGIVTTLGSIKDPLAVYAVEATKEPNDSNKLKLFTYEKDGVTKLVFRSYTIGTIWITGLDIDNPEPTEGGGCLIATAAYGSEMAPQVQFLREIRDNTVLQTQSGTSFMTAFNSFYYTFSPTIADYERENPVFKEAVKVGLTPLLTSLTILNYVDIDTEQEMLGYGIGIIMLNIGMYFVAPAVVVIALSKKLRK